jgi:hypothetical protein
MKALVAAIALALAVPSGPVALSAYELPNPSPNCPWNQSSQPHTWVGYLLGQYGDKEPHFSIKFDKTIGTITAGHCYTVTYLGGGSWFVPTPSGRFQDGVYKGGTPDKYQINVWGAPLLFNEGGEVKDSRINEVVGSLWCHIGPECDK